MQHIGLIDCFDLIIGGDSGQGDKSSGKPAKFACSQLGLEAKNVIAIGDAPMDNDMALKSNLVGSLLVQSGQIPIDSLAKITDYSVKSLSEVSLSFSNK